MSSYLGELIIKLTGDSASFSGEIDKAEKKIKQFSESAKTIGSNLTKFVTLPIVALGTLAVKNFTDAEDAEAGFNAALLATGKQAEISTKNIKAYTAELQKVTVYEDDAQLAALGMVQSLANLSEDGLKKILPRLLDFSAAMKVDLQTAASLFGKTLGSTTNALARYGIQIEDGLEGEKKLAALTDVLDSKFKGYAETTAKLGSGPMKQLLNTLGDLGESFGEVILPVINELIPPIKAAIEAFGSLDSGTKKMIVAGLALAAAIGPIIGVVGNLISVITTLGTTMATVGAVAGPILVVAAAIGITALEMAKYKKNTEETIAIQQGFIKVVDNSKDSLDKFRESLSKGVFINQENLKGLQNDRKEVENQINAIQKKIEELKKGSTSSIRQSFTFESLKTEPVAAQRQEIFKLSEELKKLQAVRDVLIQQESKLQATQKETNEVNLSSGLDWLNQQKEEIENAKLIDAFNTIEQENAENQLTLIDQLILKKKEEAEEFKKAEEKKIQALNNFDTIASKVTSSISQITQLASQNNVDRVTAEYDKKKALIEANVTDETARTEALEKLELEKEATIAAAKRKAFIANKTAAIIESVINTAVGVSKALTLLPPVSYVLAGITAAAGLVQTGLIAAQPIPQFAEGGYITAQPGGTLGLLAESGSNEFAIPDRNDVMGRIADRITNNMSRGTQTNNTAPIFEVRNELIGEKLVTYINKKSRSGAIQVSPKRGVSKR